MGPASAAVGRFRLSVAAILPAKCPAE
ncbi:hypothetical protein BGLA2_810040 [Burkholderia gladioli]|nr:hypothetical protein BGLA2_810040 [Burkholderia gladioli]